MHEVTRVLLAIEQGDRQAAEQLLPLVYEELRQLAAEMMAREKPGGTLQATALVHEAYIRLVGSEQGQHWDGRRHFFAAAVEAMRRILVDQARTRRSLRRGGGLNACSLEGAEIAAPEPSVDIVAVHEALQRLERVHPVRAELVKLRYFGGLSIEQAAAVLGISSATASRYWTYARAWLHAELARPERGPES